MTRLAPRPPRSWSRAALACAAAFVAFAAATTTSSPVRAADPAVRDVSAALETARARHDLPGMVGVTVESGRIVARGATGVRRRGGADRITVDDRMHLGSCTKAMTATLCALLVEAGTLRWDDRPAAAFAKGAKAPAASGDADHADPAKPPSGAGLGPGVPRDVPKIDDGWRDATLEMLLRNRGGAPHDLEADGLWGRLWKHPGPPPAARMALVAGVLGRPPVAPPGTKFVYSNAGFAMAGAMAERAAGRSWETLVRERLFEPLGMRTAGFGAPRTAGRTGEPCGHRADGTPVDPGPGDDNPDAIAPAGKVHASLPDWARFVWLHVGRRKGVEGPLARIDFDRLHTPVRGSGDAEDPHYAMGWMVTERPWAKGAAPGDHGRALTHAGSNTMWYCVAWLAPERGFAVLVATNQGGDEAAKACDEAAGALIRDETAPR